MSRFVRLGYQPRESDYSRRKVRLRLTACAEGRSAVRSSARGDRGVSRNPPVVALVLFSGLYRLMGYAAVHGPAEPDPA